MAEEGGLYIPLLGVGRLVGPSFRMEAGTMILAE
jgi:hypothetical protein